MKKQLFFLAMVVLLPLMSTHSQVKNGDMEKTTNTKWPWNLVVSNEGTSTPGEATMTYAAYNDKSKGHFLQIIVTAANTEKPWALRVRQGDIIVARNATKITFRARGTNGGEVLRVRYDGDGNIKPQADFKLTTAWTDYELALPASSQGTKNSLAFWTQSVSTYQIDDVSVDY